MSAAGSASASASTGSAMQARASGVGVVAAVSVVVDDTHTAGLNANANPRHKDRLVRDPLVGVVAYMADSENDEIREFLFHRATETVGMEFNAQPSGFWTFGGNNNNSNTPDHGPTCIRFHPNVSVAYVLNAKSNTVAVFQVDRELLKAMGAASDRNEDMLPYRDRSTLRLVQTVQTTIPSDDGNNNNNVLLAATPRTCQDMFFHPSGCFVLVSCNHGHHHYSIATFSVVALGSKVGHLKLVGHFMGGGSGGGQHREGTALPRRFHFHATEKNPQNGQQHLLIGNATNQEPVTVLHFDVGSGAISDPDADGEKTDNAAPCRPHSVSRTITASNASSSKQPPIRSNTRLSTEIETPTPSSTDRQRDPCSVEAVQPDTGSRSGSEECKTVSRSSKRHMGVPVRAAALKRAAVGSEKRPKRTIVFGGEGDDASHLTDGAPENGGGAINQDAFVAAAVSNRRFTRSTAYSPKTSITEGDAETGEMGTKAAASCSITTPSSSKDEQYWTEGNGISQKQADDLLKLTTKRCSTCLACTREPCRSCSLCRFGGTSDACVFRCCQNNTTDTKLLYADDIAKMLKRKDRCLSVGTRVHYVSNKNGHLYWGRINARIKVRGAPRWNVCYDNGRVGEKILEQDLVNEFEHALRREEVRLRDSRMKPKGRMKPKSYSSTKNIDNRCYARHENNNFYWGWIARTCRKGKLWTFSVIFENGDVLTGIHTNDVCTENDVIERFPFTKQGIQLRRPVKDHELIGKRYFRQWMDIHGRRLEVFGIITKCWQGLVDANERFFTVEYDDRFVQLNERIPEADNNVSEPDAWGGFVWFEREIGHTKQIVPAPPFHYNWIIPATPSPVPGISYPTLVTSIRGFKLSFNVAPSSIPGAGLGLWLTCEQLSLKQLSLNPLQSDFVLEAGDLISVWPYGPLQFEDLKSEVVYMWKNFIHLGSASPWSFERACHEAGYIDMTDDWSGELHEKAKNNLVAFANETNGKDEVPSLCAMHDPSGTIQYLLGHNDEAYGALTIPVNTPTELKLDYGVTYERVRAEKGYTRERHDGEKSNLLRRADEEYALAQLEDYSVANCGEALAFLERIFSRAWKTPDKKLGRALIAVLSFHARIKILFQATVAEQEMLTRVTSLVTKVCSQWLDYSQGLKEVIADMDVMLQTVVAGSIGCDLPTLAALDSEGLLHRLFEVGSTSEWKEKLVK